MVDLSSLKTEVVTPVRGRPYTVVEFPSMTNPEKVYRVDIVNIRCTCPVWVFSRKVCKHLKALGFTADAIAEVAKPAKIKFTGKTKGPVQKALKLPEDWQDMKPADWQAIAKHL